MTIQEQANIMAIQKQCELSRLAIKTLNSRIKLFKEDGIAQEYIDGLEDQKVQAKRELKFLSTTI